MAERQFERSSALHGLSLPNKIGKVTVTDAGLATRFVYRGATEHMGDAFGVELPTQPCRAARSADRTALWLGPDEWLLIVDDGDGVAVRRELAAAFHGKTAALVDVSHRNAGLVVEGPRAADLLSAGCPLDLDVREYPVDICTRTLFAKAEIVLWRTAADAFRLEVWRSFVPYVAGLLGEAARDLT
jgi:sarcosine oxidase subunit gamma